MKYPFDLPVKKTKKHPLFNPYIVDKADEKLLCMCYEEDEADYIVHVINSHEKLKSKIMRVEKLREHYKRIGFNDTALKIQQALEVEKSND